MNQITKQERDELTEESVKEYLARGGKITVCEAGARTENIQVGQWTRNRRRSPSKSQPATQAEPSFASSPERNSVES